MIDNLREAQVSLDRAEKMAALGRFAGALAHEVRTPLSSISMLLSLEQEKMAEGRTREALTMALAEIEKLSLLSTKLLTFVRGPSIDLKPGSLSAVIEEILSLMAGQFEHLKITIDRNLAGPLPEVMMDSGAFRHVILNLVQNAVDAMPFGGRLTISTRHEGDRVFLEIADEGVGIAESDAHFVFEPFFTKKSGGTGLGLAITKAIVEAHNGLIRHFSGAVKGTIFVVELLSSAVHDKGGAEHG